MGGFGGIIMMLKNEYFWGAVAVAGAGIIWDFYCLMSLPTSNKHLGRCPGTRRNRWREPRGWFV